MEQITSCQIRLAFVLELQNPVGNRGRRGTERGVGRARKTSPRDIDISKQSKEEGRHFPPPSFCSERIALLYCTPGTTLLSP